MKKILYLGVDPKSFLLKGTVVHYPVIKLVPRELQEAIKPFTYCLLTSKNSVKFLKKHLDLRKFKCISIGPSTSFSLREEGVEPAIECSNSTQEGMIEEVSKLSKEEVFFYPRSSRARSLLYSYLKKEGYSFQVLDLYDTILQKQLPVPSLEEFEEVVFTSPSTVDGFFQIYSSVPEGIKVTFQGPITKEAYNKRGVRPRL